MKTAYKIQTKESNWIPKEIQIKEYILSFYNGFGYERDEKLILESFFEKSCPEKEIIELIRKNNEFIINNNSNKEPKIKEVEKSKIY